MVQTDIIGAIFMVDNASSCMLARHSNTRYHFSQEQLEDRFNKTIFVRTDGNNGDIYTKNNGDIYTKNVNRDTNERHVTKFLGGLTKNWLVHDKRVIEGVTYICYIL
jgi:hypothetical protein